jgi:hypothetical protein
MASLHPYNIPGSVVGLSGWIIAIAHDEAASSISQYVIDLLLGELPIKITARSQSC